MAKAEKGTIIKAIKIASFFIISSCKIYVLPSKTESFISELWLSVPRLFEVLFLGRSIG
jgi:hypothetical protein